MKLNKKLFLGLGSTLTGLSTVAMVVSCQEEIVDVKAQQDQSQHYHKTNYSNISSLVESKKAEVEKAKSENTFKELRIGLVTAGGDVNDKSFNQSMWEAVSQHSLQVGATWNRSVNSPGDKLANTYNSFMGTNLNVWVLTGFQQAEAFETWYKQNKDSFDSRDITVIGVDWSLPDGVVSPGKLITLNYKTEEAGWMAGYAIADYLSTKEQDDNKRKVATFGGGTGAGVLDFIAGYLQGIHDYNAESGNSKKTKLNTSNLELSTGFDAQDASNVRKVEVTVSSEDPKAVFPVAGSLSGTALEAIKKANKGQLIIGVDTDQSKAFEQDAKYFFTSVEKRLGSTLYRVLTDLWLQKGANSDILSGFSATSNAAIRDGYFNGFVDLSETTLAETDKTVAKASIEKAKQKFTQKVEAVKSKYENDNKKVDVKKEFNIPVMTISPDPKNAEALNALAAKINAQ
ncbi:BMP family ABC transporter substrate-binding protein [Mesomycoplasma lagogenitalium]|uniref:BMP family ABC transporter substrate-binding protein n=1 Tax=Mesomycoplasma lagogenitalium TaxID=171286 RepID=A0ABY8LUG6_9BACT|nr:BMP family ABC transporter substrate-binding protein [Mesomycoplasma lagogenitalium]WGI36874.1 BMP family ABC transporter substrate-binding protein [Mesomycoplasma lagogenitalium]